MRNSLYGTASGEQRGGPQKGPSSNELLAEIQEIDGPTLDRIHRIIQDVFNEPYLE